MLVGRSEHLGRAATHPMEEEGSVNSGCTGTSDTRELPQLPELPAQSFPFVVPKVVLCRSDLCGFYVPGRFGRWLKPGRHLMALDFRAGVALSRKARHMLTPGCACLFPMEAKGSSKAAGKVVHCSRRQPTALPYPVERGINNGVHQLLQPGEVLQLLDGSLWFQSLSRLLVRRCSISPQLSHRSNCSFIFICSWDGASSATSYTAAILELQKLLISDPHSWRR